MITGVILTSVKSGVGIESAKAEVVLNELKENVPFRIIPLKGEHLTLDSFGDNLPKWKTSVHLYSRYGSDGTSEIIPYFQPQHNNSFELHMQNDRDLCVGPDVTRAVDMRPGTMMMVKRDCANTLNHVYEYGSQLRVNNTNYCIDIPNSNLSQLVKLQYYPCNQTNAQQLKLVKIATTIKTYPGSCYRRDRWINEVKCTTMQIPNGVNTFEYLGGAWAEVIFYNTDPGKVTDTWEAGSGGFVVSKSKETQQVQAYKYILKDGVGIVNIPQGVQTYSVLPWSDNATTRYQFFNK